MLINQNIPNQNPPNFKAKIKFAKSCYGVLPANKMFAKDSYVGFPWQIENSKIVSEGYSDCASVCTIGFIKPKDGDKGYLFHLIPMYNPFEKIEKQLSAVIENFQKQKGAVEAILSGASIHSETSMKQAENLMKLFDNLGVEYSAFLGQKIGREKTEGVNMFVSIPRDEYIISVGSSVPEKLEHKFKIVKKSSNDEIIFE